MEIALEIQSTLFLNNFVCVTHFFLVALLLPSTYYWLLCVGSETFR